MQFTYGQPGLGKKAADRARPEFAGLSVRAKHICWHELSRANSCFPCGRRSRTGKTAAKCGNRTSCFQ